MNNFYHATEILRQVLLDVGFTTVSFGSLSNSDLARQELMPLVHIVPQPMQIGSQAITYNFTISGMDIVDFNKDDINDEEENSFYTTNNLQDVYNDIAIRFSNFEAILRKKDLPYLTEVSIGTSAVPFEEKGKNLYAGWALTIGLTLPSDATIC